MTDSTAEATEAETSQADDASGSSFWPDELVDTISALVVVTTLTLGVLWFVVNG